MAKALQTTTLNLLISLTFVFSFLRLTTANDDYYNLVQRKHGFKHEKLTHFHFYFHSKWQEPDERPSGRGANDEHFGHIFWHGRSVRRPFDGGTRANFQAGGKSSRNHGNGFSVRCGTFNEFELCFH
ncbi:hypothetical protein CsatB_019544 [Cannabis sativa]